MYVHQCSAPCVGHSDSNRGHHGFRAPRRLLVICSDLQHRCGTGRGARQGLDTRRYGVLATSGSLLANNFGAPWYTSRPAATVARCCAKAPSRSCPIGLMRSSLRPGGRALGADRQRGAGGRTSSRTPRPEARECQRQSCAASGARRWRILVCSAISGESPNASRASSWQSGAAQQQGDDLARALMTRARSTSRWRMCDRRAEKSRDDSPDLLAADHGRGTELRFVDRMLMSLAR